MEQNTAQQLEFEAMKAELERLKSDKQATQANVLKFATYDDKKRIESATAADFKKACLQDCKTELTAYFLNLNPRNPKTMKLEKYGEYKEPLIAAITRAVHAKLPAFPFKLEMMVDNFVPTENERIDHKLDRIDGRAETERPVTEDWVKVSFTYSNCYVGPTNAHAAYAVWTNPGDKCTDSCRLTFYIKQREVVVSR